MPFRRLLALSPVYRLWIRPAAAAKFAPILRHNDLGAVRSVLDVGCGPGTNAGLFPADLDYLGLDLNPRYVASASRRHPGRAFEVADVTRWDGGGRRFDFILVNSFFHHIDDADSRRILAHLATLLEPEGRIHVLALALPTRFDPAYALAKLDRGDHPRRLSAWRELFHVDYQVELFEPYPVGLPGVPLWNMVYFRGKAKPRG